MRKALVVMVLLALAGAAGWYYRESQSASADFALYGNVEFDQADLAFHASRRVAEILVDEGDAVHAGQVLARQDVGNIEPQIAQAEATIAYNEAVVAELRNGSRPEEIAQARANLVAAETDAANLKVQYDRVRQLVSTSTASQQALDEAQAASEISAAKVIVSRRTLDLVLAGPREEKISQAEAQLDGARAQLAVLKEQLADMELKSPADGVIRSKLMEPGEIATPSRAVLSLAMTGDKRVRAYVSESELGLIREGMAAQVAVDSAPEKTFVGRVGFISPVAEFTPKTVQTEELRSSLVYEVRVHVEDPHDQLRLGMPATVTFAAAGSKPGEGAGS